ncbi:Do family serine endopeptidase [Brackiella oedipodis]|uniref:Do family serine endopeptidase n=1 Tax=Brackiella oedipodis TaxID=124225 RepID=UPI00048B101B|nr:Do family serine endopeptidase [Brackiella oedipodis]
MNFKKSVLFAVLSLSLFNVGLANAEETGINSVQANVANAPAVNPQAPLVTGLPDFTQVVKATENAVVNIRTEETLSRRGLGSFAPGQDPDEIFRFFFGPEFDNSPFFGQQGPYHRANPYDRQAPKPNPDEEERTVPSGVGSGFIISEDGYIITNNHVVDGASKIIVSLNDGKEYKAKVIGTDKRTDIALLKIEAKHLQSLKIGHAGDLQKGQWVLAIGSPFDLDSTVTAGIVSAINRDTGDYLPFIQTDVAVNPGNSGGPLINLKGEVVGVNSQIISRSGGFMGVSLSIPIDEVMKVVEQLKATGKVTRGRIGVSISEIPKEVAETLNLPNSNGALVGNVEPQSAAAKAGVQAGDVILSFDGQKINKWSDLPRIVGQTKPGKKVPMQIWRRGKDQTLDITVTALQDPSGLAQAGSNADGQNTPTTADRFGLTVSDLTPDIAQRANVKGGVVVRSITPEAQQQGLMTGDIILAVNNQEVVNSEQYLKAVKALAKDKLAALLIRRDNTTQWVTIKPKK